MVYNQARNGIFTGFTYNFWPVFCLFLLSPLISLPFILAGIYRQKVSALFLLSVFIGLLAWLQVPTNDLYRHTMQYYNYAGKDFDWVINDPTYTDYISSLGKWILVNNGLTYQWYRLFWVAESFFVVAYALNDYILRSTRVYTRKEVFLYFLIWVLFFEFIQTTSGVRYCCACYNYAFALYLFFNRKKYLLGFLFLFVALKTHSSFNFFIPLSFLLYFLCRTRTMAFIGVVVGFIMVSIVLSMFGEALLGRSAEFYFKDGISGSGGSTSIGFVLFILVRLFLLPFAYIGFRYFNLKSPWTRMTLVWASIFIIFITNEVMIFRCAVFLSVVGIFALLECESKRLISHRLFDIVIWCGIFTTVFNAVNYRGYISSSSFEKIAAPVVPVILDNVYDKQWLNSNISGDQMKKKYN